MARLKRSALRLGFGGIVAALLGLNARADNLSHAKHLQKEVAAIMAVLRSSNADPNTGCASALDDMNTTDNQLTQLSGSMQYDNESPPVLEHNSGELNIGRDVLLSDMEEMVAKCRPQAEQTCTSPTIAAMVASCAKLNAIPDRSVPGQG